MERIKTILLGQKKLEPSMLEISLRDNCVATMADLFLIIRLENNTYTYQYRIHWNNSIQQGSNLPISRDKAKQILKGG